MGKLKISRASVSPRNCLFFWIRPASLAITIIFRRRKIFWPGAISVRSSRKISGETKDVAIADIVNHLKGKARWIFDHIRRQEIVTVKDQEKNCWFNGYYDNQGKRVEGNVDGRVRMTLTGQVFSVMSGLASKEEVNDVVASVDHFLKDKTMGGYRLNTDFGLRHYLDLGRAFGFAYGTKENGAFFSHMNVMYAYALYKRGFVHQGYEVLHSIYRMASDPVRAKIYPGIPEYFDSEGRGMYHYMGSAEPVCADGIDAGVRRSRAGRRSGSCAENRERTV